MRTEAPEEKPPAAPKGSRRQRRSDRRAASGEGRFGQRLLPKSIVGVVVLMLAAAIGFAFGGTVLYAYYQYKTDKLEKRITDFISGYEDRVEEAKKEIDQEKQDAVEEVRKEIEPIKELRASGETLRSLVDKVKDSVYLIETQDEFGRPQAGSAFVVTSDAERSYLLTSLSVVKAATRRPGPPVTLRKGNERIDATLWTWQEERDLALLIVNKGSLPRVKWAAADQPPQYGERIFDVAGVGGAGGSITQGFVADVSAAGIMHDAAVTGPFAGGPILNSKGEVLGVGAPGYTPLGFTSDRVTFAPYIRAACEKVLKCPAGAADAGGAGERR
ncbi:MAG TPA: trypsin-like peptidase domain-containing protein [Acidimicrobiia bacterium]|nr:trypsin-like peptidase domain-containing protein [Acidimicrobiia bacterium]